MTITLSAYIATPIIHKLIAAARRELKHIAPRETFHINYSGQLPVSAVQCRNSVVSREMENKLSAWLSVNS